MKQYDLIIVGAGVMGLAHAYHAARRGLSVAVVDRSAHADGASVRNFGMLAIVAQQPGPELESARNALRHWQRIAAGADISLRQAGCVFVARCPEEMQVLRESAAMSGHAFDLLSPEDIQSRIPNVRQHGLLGGIWSPEAWKLDQRRAMAKMAQWLAREHGVEFFNGTDVRAVDSGNVQTSSGVMKARHVIACGGNEFSTLFPDAFKSSGVSTCRLRMLRTVARPQNWQLSPFVLGGLSLTRYTAFQDCPGIDALHQWQETNKAAHLRHGIHVIAAQEDDGSITIGDSHHYTEAPNAEDRAEIEQLILQDLSEMVDLPDPRIAQRWEGQYAHLSGQALLKISPIEGVTAVTITNGQGMTHGLSVAEDIVAGIL